MIPGLVYFSRITFCYLHPRRPTNERVHVSTPNVAALCLTGNEATSRSFEND